MATAEDLLSLRGVVEEMERVNREREAALEDRLQDADARTDHVCQELQNRTQQMQRSIDASTDHISRAQTDLDELASRMKNVQDQQSDMEQRENSVHEQLLNLQGDLYQKIEDMADRLTLAAGKEHEAHRSAHFVLKSQIEATFSEKADIIAALKSETEASLASLTIALHQGLKDLDVRCQTDLTTARQNLEQNLQQVQEELVKASEVAQIKVEAVRETMEKSLKKDIMAAEAAARDAASQALAAAEEGREKYQDAVDLRLDGVDKQSKHQEQELRRNEQQTTAEVQKCRSDAEERSVAVLAESRAGIRLLECEQSKLKDDSAAVAGIPTRQVEWTIGHEAFSQLQHWQLKMDLSAAHHKDGGASGVDYASWFSPSFEAACSRGIQLELRYHGSPASSHGKDSTGGHETGNCSLYLWAQKGLQLVFRLFLGTESVVLRHCFDGASPCGMKRMGMLSDQMQIDGMLKVGVEIHEALLSTEPVHRETEAKYVETMALQPVVGSLVAQQCVNHRLLELIQCQGRGLLDQLTQKVDLVRSRATRRVQWRLENASLLRQSFAEGQPVCSTAFQAAGISGLQLVFYPSGCAGARAGFCSFFLCCPSGCLVRCWLWAGRGRREARAESAERPDLLGRINFCRFENCVDPVDESIELALEIEEATQATTREGPVAAVDSNPTSVSKDRGMERADLSTLKVQHGPGSKASPESVQQLPAIWTSHGFHSFGDVNDASVDRKHSSAGQSRANTCSPGMPLSPSLTPGLPRPGTTGCSGSRMSTPRTVSRSTPRGFAPPGAHKYKEYLAGV